MRYLYLFLSALLIMLLTALGLWQLQRGFEKQNILDQQALKMHTVTQSWLPEMPLPMSFAKISVTGRYLEDIFLLDNQHIEHQFGLNIISPLLIDEQHVILVDRGFIALIKGRDQLPAIKTPAAILTLAGQVYYPPEKNWLLGAVIDERRGKTIIVEHLDLKIIGNILHKPLYPFIIRLNTDEPHGFTRQWMTVSMPPARHYAYALQWFLLALVAAVGIKFGLLKR